MLPISPEYLDIEIYENQPKNGYFYWSCGDVLVDLDFERGIDCLGESIDFETVRRQHMESVTMHWHV